MHFTRFSALLSFAAVQVAAFPSALPEPEIQTPFVNMGTPRMITPKYRKTAKRAIIRYPAFTLAAKGASNQILTHVV
jgi:hypothetical protein